MPPRAPRVEVIVPVHDPTRPLSRAVASLVHERTPDLEVTVVCHGVAADTVATALGDLRDEVRLLEFTDGRPSPAGPRTAALAASTAEFVAFVDSDDWLEPGAIATWLDVADAHDAAAVIALERHASGRPVRNPPVRPWTVGRLDPQRDRLAYRSALRGLFRRSAIAADGVEFDPSVENGSDLAFTLRTWYSGRPVVLASRRPAYVLGDDAVTRVTRAARTLAAETAAARHILDAAWYRALPDPDRRMIATKFVRIHLLPGLAARLGWEGGSETTAEALRTARDVLATADAAAPGFESALSRTDERLVTALRSPDADAAALRPLLDGRRRFSRPSNLLPRRLRDALRRDAPPRLASAGLLLGWRMPRHPR